MNLAELETKVLTALRENVEGDILRIDGRPFMPVYLDNALGGMNRRQFAGVLSSLQAKGYYRSQGDDFFGDVLIEE